MHLCLHCCLHLCKASSAQAEKEHQATLAANRAKDRAEDRRNEKECAPVRAILEKSQSASMSPDDRTAIDTFLQKIHVPCDSLGKHTRDVVQKILEKGIKTWDDLPSGLKESPAIADVLHDVKDVAKRIEYFTTLTPELQSNTWVISSLVQDPIESMPHLHDANLVTKEVALKALNYSTTLASKYMIVTRDDRTQIWQRYINKPIQQDPEVLAASVQRPGCEDCCCPSDYSLPNWGGSRFANRKIEIVRSMWETTYLQRCCCAPCNAWSDVQEIERRKNLSEIERPMVGEIA